MKQARDEDNLMTHRNLKAKWFIAHSMKQVGWPQFKVTGPAMLADSETMDWHITDAQGRTIAISCDDEFADTLNALMALAYLLDVVDAEHILSEAHDSGTMNCTDEQWNTIKTHFQTISKISVDVRARLAPLAREDIDANDGPGTTG